MCLKDRPLKKKKKDPYLKNRPLSKKKTLI